MTVDRSATYGQFTLAIGKPHTRLSCDKKELHMTSKTVYLAGPVTGLTIDESSSWRNYISDILCPDIKCLDPLRGGKEDRPRDQPITDHPEATRYKEVAEVARDLNDIRRSDAVAVNLLGAKSISQGTLYEIGYAVALGKSVVVAVESSGNVHEHMFLRQIPRWRVSSLCELAMAVRGILLP